MQCLLWEKLELKLIPDPNMYMSFEKGTAGGVSYISNKYTKTNSKYLESYYPKQESKYIIYFHANKLYGNAMPMFLPTSTFKWIDSKEFDVNKNTSNSSKGCVLEVDLEYPNELRELNNGYPLAVDKIEIKTEMLFKCQLKIADHYIIPIGNVKKWVSELFNKERYVSYYENLQLYLRLGLKLKKYIVY